MTGPAASWLDNRRPTVESFTNGTAAAAFCRRLLAWWERAAVRDGREAKAIRDGRESPNRAGVWVPLCWVADRVRRTSVLTHYLTPNGTSVTIIGK